MFSAHYASHWSRCVPLVVALWTTAHAAGPSWNAILGGAGQDYAASVATDSQGNVYVAGLTYSPDFPTTAAALQPKIGSVGASDAFVSKFAPDGTLRWSTFLGGSGDDWATGIAVDSSGNILVTGWTRSADFPTLHALQPTLNNGMSPARYDAFVAKLDATGSKLLYSTFLGGAGDDGASGLAVDSAGNAYIAGAVESSEVFPGLKNQPSTFGIFVTKLDPQGALVYSFLHPYGSVAGIAVDAAGSAYVAGTLSSSAPVNTATRTFGLTGAAQAIVFKLTPDGSKKLFETALGGSARADGLAVAVDHTGSVYLAGSTTSVDFPLVHPLQSSLGARPLWKSADGGLTWKPLDDLPFANLQALLVDPTAPDTLYAAASDVGIFKSLDGGRTWTSANQGIASPRMQSLAIDPLHPQVIYAGTAAGANPGGVYKTVDGGSHWAKVDPADGVTQIAVDAHNPNNVYAVGNNGPTRQTTDSGATWSRVPFPVSSIQTLALDPQASGTVFAYSVPIFFLHAGTPSFLYRSVNGGADWVSFSSPSPASPGITVDSSTNPSTVYLGLSARSLDGGLTWTSLAPSPVAGVDLSTVAVDPSGVLYGATFGNGLYASHDRARTWTPIGSPAPPSPNYSYASYVTALVPAGASGTLYAVLQNTQSSGFVTRLSPDGSTIVYSTLLNGHASTAPVTIYAAEPGVFATQNWISSIAIDAAGNLAVAGATRSNDIPTVGAAQAANAGKADAFAALISADGSSLKYSTYLGGSGDDGALAVAADSQGNLIVAGQTWSFDFPVPGGVKPPAGQLGDMFVAKLALPAAPVIASVLDAASFKPAIEAGSWVAIRGTGLANTNPGRMWRSDEVVNGNLPTSLDGVSVTINGKPAFVYYISPTQINVQAPSDTAVGAVDVVVTNNGAASAPATAKLQAVAPAFFQFPGTSYVTASRLPDYALVADPGVIPGAVGVAPGDLVVLWGTGFGPTSPPTPAGVVVSGAPPVATPPVVTVGGLPAEVLGTVLTTGTVGLYQVTIRIPSATPPGPVSVQASSGGVRTVDGVLIFAR